VEADSVSSPIFALVLKSDTKGEAMDIEAKLQPPLCFDHADRPRILQPPGVLEP
jgi:hypothetical protein